MRFPPHIEKPRGYTHTSSSYDMPSGMPKVHPCNRPWAAAHGRPPKGDRSASGRGRGDSPGAAVRKRPPKGRSPRSGHTRPAAHGRPPRSGRAKNKLRGAHARPPPTGGHPMGCRLKTTAQGAHAQNHHRTQVSLNNQKSPSTSHSSS